MITRVHVRVRATHTRAESLGHQPRQAAGGLGSAEVVVLEAPDGGHDEGRSHPPVVCRISHRSRACARVRAEARSDRAPPPECG